MKYIIKIFKNFLVSFDDKDKKILGYACTFGWVGMNLIVHIDFIITKSSYTPLIDVIVNALPYFLIVLFLPLVGGYFIGYSKKIERTKS